MKKEHENFENDMFKTVLAKNLREGKIDANQFNKYIAQHESAAIKFIDNGVGFYFEYTRPNIEDENTIILSGGNYTSKSHPDLLVEIILFLKNDTIEFMEGHGYGEYITPIFFEDYMESE